jgi:hypothetical protein
MALKSSAVSVGTTATRLDTADDTGDHAAGESLVFYNNGAQMIYIGGPDVSTSNGGPVAASSWSPAFDLSTGDVLYGIVASGTAEARVVESGI